MNIDEIKDDHATYIFPKNKNSEGTQDDGTSYDHSFPTENGRVSYVYDSEKELYLVTLTLESGESSTRVASFDILSGWFYNPTSEYFTSNISTIQTIV